ncbi:hypothetical protein CBR_g11986 [Chara braunii]|uniref:Uncharacterized protein n=1 Tax=Chara braunii TaxID=69332 RepID=A0A388KQU1_CHABU|nr:hypothetical protein CBR_g11986 [Chara braunii]|eukprot:GBG72407.1 hypothetical protein CBR_g11986 [Chara braunii]
MISFSMGPNVEDFEDSIALCAERKWWKEEEKLKQVMTRVNPREYENVRKIKEESNTWGGFFGKFRRTYTLVVQRQKKKQLLQEQGLWIGRRGERLERKGQQEIDEDDVTLKQVLDNKRTTTQKGNGSASKITRVQKKGRSREKKRSKEEEEESEQDKEGEEERKEEVEEVAKGKEEVKENEKEEDEKNQTGRETGTTAAENPLKEPASRRTTKEEREKREERK